MGRLGRLLAVAWGVLGASWGVLIASWRVLGALKGIKWVPRPKTIKVIRRERSKTMKGIRMGFGHPLGGLRAEHLPDTLFGLRARPDTRFNYP